ncbi:hypothetical protein [Candidatus Pristimantibacillus sp. PTI5]|uniref:hypothetical protein n=1 Tax=Candidatus Pristimantibacillus sp. PTI5 TaxID=3400422 RepID=UPI003B010441
MANSPLQKKASSSRESIKSTPGQPSVTSERPPSAAAPSNVLQLQRTAGSRRLPGDYQLAEIGSLQG